jgi:hypothetical protein
LTEKAASGAGKKWPREGNGQGGNWFWVFSLSRSKTELLAFPLKKPPLLQLLRAIFIGEGGAGTLLRMGSRGHQARSSSRGHGALSFGSSMQSLIVSCLKGRGALAACGKRNSVKTTLFNFFIYYIFIFLFVGTQKWVATHVIAIRVTNFHFPHPLLHPPTLFKSSFQMYRRPPFCLLMDLNIMSSLLVISQNISDLIL